MVELFTTGPANILKLNAGTLAPGAPADLTILDIEREWTYDVDRSYSKSRNTPFDGQHFRGGPVATIVNGVFAWRL
jgi:dihydroorotase